MGWGMPILIVSAAWTAPASVRAPNAKATGVRRLSKFMREISARVERLGAWRRVGRIVRPVGSRVTSFLGKTRRGAYSESKPSDCHCVYSRVLTGRQKERRMPTGGHTSHRRLDVIRKDERSLCPPDAPGST